jgi:hypothetical protein
MAAEVTPALLQDVRVDAAMNTLFDGALLAWPYDRAYWVLDHHALGSARLFQNLLTDFEPAQTTLPWSGDHLDQGRPVSAYDYLRGLVAAEAGGRFWWDARAGVFRLHHRHHDALSTTPLLTLTEAELTGATPAYAEDVINAVTVHYEPRITGATGTTLWETNEFTLRPGEARTFGARYTLDTASVGALTVITPEAGQDVMALDEETGADVTDRLGWSCAPAATAVRLTLINHHDRRVRVTRLRVRGTPLIHGARESVTVQDAASIAAYDRRERSLELPTVSDTDFASAIARATLARYANPRSRFTRISFIAQASAALAAAALDRTVGDRIAIRDAWSGHSADYIIVGERHTLDARLRQQHVTWVLKAAARDPYFILQTSALDDVDVLAL